MTENLNTATGRRRADVTPNRWITSPTGRRWLYRIALAVIALCVSYGLLADESAALWGALVAALVSLPVADANAPTGYSGKPPAPRGNV